MEGGSDSGTRRHTRLCGLCGRCRAGTYRVTAHVTKISLALASDQRHCRSQRCLLAGSRHLVPLGTRGTCSEAPRAAGLTLSWGAALSAGGPARARSACRRSRRPLLRRPGARGVTCSARLYLVVSDVQTISSSRGLICSTCSARLRLPRPPRAGR